MSLNSPQSDTLVKALVDSSSFLSSLNGRSSTSQLPTVPSCSRTSSSSSHTSVTVPVQRNALPEPMLTATDTHHSTDSQSQSGPSQDAISAPASTGCPAPESGLPPFATASCVYQIGSWDVESSLQIIRSAYAEAAHYRPNLFSIPSGTVGTQFVNNLSRFFKCFGDCSTGEGITLKAAMVYCQLTLQQPLRAMDRQTHVDCLRRRLALLDAGDINSLLIEARTVQQLKNGGPKGKPATKQTSDEGRKFSSLVYSRKTGAAVRMLCEDQMNGHHQLGNTVNNHTVYDILKEKHPSAELLDPSAAIPGPCPPPPHSILFTALDRKAIRKAALKTTGAAGPTGMFAGNWRRVCTSFGSSSDDLCDALASCARRIASSTIDPAALEAYVACRLIPLDKQPGVRPIGIVEVVRRIIGLLQLRPCNDFADGGTYCSNEGHPTVTI